MRSIAYVEDWQRCINCKEPGRRGKIRHLRGCPEYVTVRATEAARPALPATTTPATGSAVRVGDLPGYISKTSLNRTLERREDE